MNSNDHSAQDYSNLQTENSFAPSQVLDNNNELNYQHASINNTQNITFEFYLALPNDMRVYHVTYTYTELDSFETARRLNNNINLSHIPNYQFPYHYNIQPLIHQQIHQQVQQSAESQIYQSQQQPFDPMETSQVYSDDNIYNAASIPSNGSISDDMQDTEYDGVSVMQPTPIQNEM